MIKKHFLTIVIFCLVGITFWLVLKNAVKKDGSLVGPTPTSEPSTVSNAPKTYSFDSSTDLKAELEKVNPQILDSDF